MLAANRCGMRPISLGGNSLSIRSCITVKFVSVRILWACMVSTKFLQAPSSSKCMVSKVWNRMESKYGRTSLYGQYRKPYSLTQRFLRSRVPAPSHSWPRRMCCSTVRGLNSLVVQKFGSPKCALHLVHRCFVLFLASDLIPAKLNDPRSAGASLEQLHNKA